MAPRLNDRRKQKIIADYVELQSVNATARQNGVSWSTVKNILNQNGEIEKKLEQKKAENTADILAYMDAQKERVCQVIDIALDELPQRLRDAKSATEITTALGTILDKWTKLRGETDTAEAGVIILPDVGDGDA